MFAGFDTGVVKRRLLTRNKQPSFEEDEKIRRFILAFPIILVFLRSRPITP
jgi:hypothetical protein